MQTSLSPFSKWALDDNRTPDERYVIWLVCEACRLIEWQQRPVQERMAKLYRNVPLAYHKELYLNPLLMPEITVEATERAAAMAPLLTKFGPPGYSEVRRIGDGGAVLRFFPALEVLVLPGGTLRDISFVEDLPNLRTLHIICPELEDLGPLRHCAQLRELNLSLTESRHPRLAPAVHWVDASALGALQQLERLTFAPNAAVLSGLRFPALVSASLHGEHCVQPDCGHLPEMPALRLLTLSGVQSLRGITRFPELRHLIVEGPLRDFGDLPALPHLDCLEIKTEYGWPRDVSPLASLPSLKWVQFTGELPRNYWPLAGAPQLCELSVTGSPVVKLEVDAINAALPKWDHVFALPQPRPVPPLRFFAAAWKADVRSLIPQPTPEPGPDFLAHPKWHHLEALWMHNRAAAAARALLEDPEGVPIPQPNSVPNCWGRTARFSIETLEAAGKLPAIVEAWRGVMAESPHPWIFSIYLDLRLREMEMTAQQKTWLRMIEKTSRRWRDDDDDESLLRYQATQKHLIETQFRLRTAQEDGMEPDPEDFEPPDILRPEAPKSPATVTPSGASAGKEKEEENPDFALKPYDEQEKNADDDKPADGTVTTAPPPDPPADFLDDPYAHPLARSYRFSATLTFDTFYYHGDNLATVCQLLDRQPDEYHAAPEEEAP